MLPAEAEAEAEADGAAVSCDAAYSGRRAHLRGRAKIAADFGLLAAAHNLARLAVLGIGYTMGGWTTSPRLMRPR